MNRLLKLTAIIEAATGLGLVAVPALVVRLLLGGEISGASVSLGRVTGVALLALGVACWSPVTAGRDRVVAGDHPARCDGRLCVSRACGAAA